MKQFIHVAPREGVLSFVPPATDYHMIKSVRVLNKIISHLYSSK